jgi:hypothetical protein
VPDRPSRFDGARVLGRGRARKPLPFLVVPKLFEVVAAAIEEPVVVLWLLIRNPFR